MSFVVSFIGFLLFAVATLSAFLWDTAPHEYLAMFFLGITVSLAVNSIVHIEKQTTGLEPF